MYDKKIAIVTFSRNVNYGGALQEFALYVFLKNKYDVTCIDYIDPLIRANSKPVRRGIFVALSTILHKSKTKEGTGKPKRLKTYIREGLNQLYVMLSDVVRYNTRKKLVKGYDDFWKQHVRYTHGYTRDELLAGDHKGSDVYIAGSDQIWNPLKFGLSPIYFLSFVPDNIKKISYSSSFGNFHFDNSSETSQISRYLCRYSNISVREEIARKELKDVLNIDAELVLDPTLLLTKKQWMEKLSISVHKKTNEKYILVYMLSRRGHIISYAKKVSKAMGLPVYIIDSRFIFDISPKTKYFPHASPVEFVELFAHASFVITNSFHGTAFSVNFNIPFLSIDSNIPERTHSLLNLVHLQDRIVTRDGVFEERENWNMDFSKSNVYLKKERKKSIDYLISAIE